MNHKKKPRWCRCLALDSCLDSSIHRFTNSLANNRENIKQRTSLNDLAAFPFTFQTNICFVCIQRWNFWTQIWQETRVFCSMLFTVSCTNGFYGKPSSIQKNPRTKKARVWEDSSLCPETSTKTAFQEFQLRSHLPLSLKPSPVIGSFFK